METPEKEFKAKIAGLETQVDVLESEICKLDELLRGCGFPNGVETLKRTVEELLKRSDGKNPFDES